MKRFHFSEFVSNEETPVVTKNGKDVIVMLPFIMDSDQPVIFLHEGSNKVHRATVDGFETFESGCESETELFFKTQTDLPKTWEEALRKFEGTTVYYIDNESVIESGGLTIDKVEDKKNLSNIITSREETRAFRSLMKLRLIRKAWVGDFDTTRDEYESKYRITLFANEFKIENTIFGGSMLTFPTKEMAEQFLDLFKDLLDETKPLYK